MKISNTTIKLAKQQFKSKIVEDAKYLLENETMAVIYGEFIDDSDNEHLKQCLLFIINRIEETYNIMYSNEYNGRVKFKNR